MEVIIVNATDRALFRLKSINWEVLRCVVGNDQGMLIRLYLSEAAAFLEFIGSDEESAFFDASEVVAPGKVLLSGAGNEAIDLISTHVNSFTTGICRCFLKWSTLQDAGSEPARQFSTLYDPLIQLIEQGVSFGGIRKGELIFGEEGYQIPLGGWRNK